MRKTRRMKKKIMSRSMLCKITVLHWIFYRMLVIRSRKMLGKSMRMKMMMIIISLWETRKRNRKKRMEMRKKCDKRMILLLFLSLINQYV